MCKEQNKEQRTKLTSTSHTPDLRVYQFFWPRPTVYIIWSSIKWAGPVMNNSFYNPVKGMAVSNMPGKTWLWGLSDQSVQNFASCGQMRFSSSGFTNKLYPNYGQNMDKFCQHETFHLKNIQMKKENFVSPGGLEWHPILTLLLTLNFFFNVFWNSGLYIMTVTTIIPTICFCKM